MLWQLYVIITLVILWCMYGIVCIVPMYHDTLIYCHIYFRTSVVICVLHVYCEKEVK